MSHSDSFTARQNDTRPVLSRTLEYEDTGAVIDLTSATSVQFRMWTPDGTLKINTTATITNAAGGVVEYQWVAGDLDTVGRHTAEFEISFNDGTNQTVPNKGLMFVHVTPETLPQT